MPPADSLPLPRRDLVAHLRHRYYYLFHQPRRDHQDDLGLLVPL